MMTQLTLVNTSDTKDNPWDAGRDGWYNEGGGFDYGPIYIHIPTSQHGYLIVPTGGTLTPVSPAMYGLYTESNETSDGIPVYINEMGYKLYRITFNDYGTYWCISNTVTTPDNIYTYSYAESTANTPPSTMGEYAILKQ